MDYNEEDFLQISGLQHYSFCRRQWALIHIEQQWAENYRTIDGKLLHKNAHNPDYQESRGDCVIMRGLRVQSATLGVSGECDVLEFHRQKEGIPLKGRDGFWQPFPIEYKRGKVGEHTLSDALQLCAQVMCLEEMLCCKIEQGAVYYGEIRRRQTVDLTQEMREQVKTMLSEMHALIRRGYTPKVKPTKSCNACSLKDLCLPKLMRIKKVSDYIGDHWREET